MFSADAVQQITGTRLKANRPIGIQGVANGNPMGRDSFIDDRHPLFYGKAVAVLRSLPGQAGTVSLKVTSDPARATANLTTTVRP